MASASLRPVLRSKAPGLRIERSLWDTGVEVVAGMDEVGRGSWAGPVTVAAVVADPDKRIYKVRDSKMLTPAEREALCDRIRSWARAVSVGHASVAECNAFGMADAQRLAARRAAKGLGVEVAHVLVDGSWDFLTPAAPVADLSTRTSGEPDSNSGSASAVSRDANLDSVPAVTCDANLDSVPEVTTIVRGDASSLSIAAASVVAKVTRDRLMVAASQRYPVYRFASNKGYPCPRHIAALAAWGPCAIHRRRWVFMDGLRWNGVPRIVAQSPDQQPSLFDITPRNPHGDRQL